MPMRTVKDLPLRQRVKYYFQRKPKVGDQMFFKGQYGRVIYVDVNARRFVFEWGEQFRGKPRFTTAAMIHDAEWLEAANSWHLRDRDKPRVVRGQVVRPDPVRVDGRR